MNDYIFWNEPFGQAEGRTLSQTCRVSKVDIIAMQKSRTDKGGDYYRNNNDLVALEDFIIVHWAWEGDENGWESHNKNLTNECAACGQPTPHLSPCTDERALRNAIKNRREPLSKASAKKLAQDLIGNIRNLGESVPGVNVTNFLKSAKGVRIA